MRRGSLALVFVLLAGCTSGPVDYPVSGTVKWNGEPIPKGVINFIAEDYAIAPDTAPIINGKYEGRVKAGRKKIEVYAYRPLKGDPVMNQQGQECYIPNKYNALSTMVREIKPDGANKFDFDLTPD